jgi:2-polyprenyl-3-methyl-5-hydroxy-6-metoxy-1,4-benzoquinol methylase
VSYLYPDLGDALTSNGVQNMGDAFRAYYQLSEQRVLSRFTDLLMGHERLLDVGCGDGRLVSLYVDRVSQVVLNDADSTRLASARARVASLGAKAVVDERPLHELDQHFDVVLCSHVIQHLAAEQFVPQLTSVTRPGGLLALTTAYALHGDGFCVESFLLEGRPQSRYVSRARFDALCASPTPGQLPTRSFARAELTQLLEQSKFEMLELRSYHVGAHDFERMGATLEVDDWVNEDPLRARDADADVLVLARRRP